MSRQDRSSRDRLSQASSSKDRSSYDRSTQDRAIKDRFSWTSQVGTVQVTYGQVASTKRNDHKCLKFGGCLKGVWILSEVSFEGVGRVSGWCTEGVCMIARGCLDGIWRVYMASFKVLWRMTLTNVKFFEFLKSQYTKSKSFSTKTKVVPENWDL